jgi:hypothetical protein
MPTVEELASLLKKSKKSGVHIDPVFGNKQTRCWTIDNCDSLYVELIGAWIVDFKQGIILQAEYKKPGVWVARRVRVKFQRGSQGWLLFAEDNWWRRLQKQKG